MTISTVIDRGVYVIAELGANHLGSVDTAIEMIDRAKWAGAPAVKGQKRSIAEMNPEILAAAYDGPHAFGPPHDRSYRGHREALELSIEDHAGLASYARSLAMDYACSAWDITSARAIRDAGLDWIKIPSALATDLTLLDEVRAYGIPVVISWGMCSDADVREGTAVLAGAEVYGLHCTSTYPMRHEDANLRCIPALHAEYVAGQKWKAVGYSDHSSGISLSAAAVALGARIIERHFSIDRSLPGSDQAASLEPDGLRRVVRDCAAVLAAMGSAEKRVLSVEESAIKKLRAAHVFAKPCRTCGHDRAAHINGGMCGMPPFHGRLPEFSRPACSCNEFAGGAR